MASVADIVCAFSVAALLLGAFATGDNLDNLIGEVFGKNNGPSEGTEGEPRTETDCTCVPYYQCSNETVVTNGIGLIDIRAKQGACEGYLDVCCKTPTQQQKRQSNRNAERSGCGKRNQDGIGFRITGDENGEAQFGEFPWMVAVLKEEENDGKKINLYQCGGALIHPQVVLTAAHYVGSAGKYKIRAGEWDTQTNSELFAHKDAGVKEILVHPDFYPGALYNDLALLFLDTELTLGDNVDVVCLPRQGQTFPRSRCLASGWGKNEFGMNGRYQVILKKIELPVVDNGDCQEALRRTRLGPHFQLHDSFMCAGGEEGRDTCKGDGGSPLVCPVEGMRNTYAQVGIVSWGIGCGGDGTPGVYANVAVARDWIDQELTKRNLDTSYYSY